MPTVPATALLPAARQDSLLYSALVHPGFKAPRHIRFLGRKLMAVERGEIKRLVVTVPVRHGKSFKTSKLFPAWWIGKHPEKALLALSHSNDLAIEFGTAVRDFANSEMHRLVFPDFGIRQDSNSKSLFRTTKGGTYRAGYLGGATGRGGDLVIVDDPIRNWEQARSEAQQEKLFQSYATDVRTRLEGEDAAIVVVMARWTIRDFVARLLDVYGHEDWEVINLPAIAGIDDPLGRAPGDPLWPEKFPLRELEKIKFADETGGLNGWYALYQQDPRQSADVIFDLNNFVFYTDLPPIEEMAPVILSWDLTFGANRKGSSWVVGQAWGCYRKLGVRRFYLLEQWRRQASFIESLEAIRSMAARYPNAEILIEEKANGAATLDTLRSEFGSRMKGNEPSGSKEDRAYAIVPCTERGEIWLPDPVNLPWVQPLLNEIDLFPLSDTDDCIDAMTQAIIRLLATSIWIGGMVAQKGHRADHKPAVEKSGKGWGTLRRRNGLDGF